MVIMSVTEVQIVYLPPLGFNDGVSSWRLPPETGVILQSVVTERTYEDGTTPHTLDLVARGCHNQLLTCKKIVRHTE